MTTEITTTNEYALQVEAEVKTFELMQRKATMLANSSLVPTQYRAFLEQKSSGKVTGYTENKNAIANCIIALDMAKRMNANELMVMQNLMVIEGRPSWSSQWIISAINGCGKYTSLKFDKKDLGDKEVAYIEYSWESNKKISIPKKIIIRNFSCVAYAIERETGERLDSATVTIEMAVKEGWYTKTGSKWQTIPEIMLQYRAASFFGKIYAPELLMGLQSAEENQDIAGDLSGKFKNVVELDNVIQTTRPPAKFDVKALEAEIANATPTVTIDAKEIVEADDIEISAEIIAKAEALKKYDICFAGTDIKMAGGA